jgi:hypothetical protein
MSAAKPRELAHREQDGLEVTLLWDPRSNDVSVELVDQRDDMLFHLPIAGRFALDAFRHPYVYLRQSENTVGFIADRAAAA